MMGTKHPTRSREYDYVIYQDWDDNGTSFTAYSNDGHTHIGTFLSLREAKEACGCGSFEVFDGLDNRTN